MICKNNAALLSEPLIRNIYRLSYAYPLTQSTEGHKLFLSNSPKKHLIRSHIAMSADEV